MTLRGIITLVILAVLFALAVVWISRQGGSAVSGLQISLYRRCSFLDRCGILGLVQQIGIYKGEY